MSHMDFLFLWPHSPCMQLCLCKQQCQSPGTTWNSALSRPYEMGLLCQTQTSLLSLKLRPRPCLPAAGAGKSAFLPRQLLAALSFLIMSPPDGGGCPAVTGLRPVFHYVFHSLLATHCVLWLEAKPETVHSGTAFNLQKLPREFKEFLVPVRSPC